MNPLWAALPDRLAAHVALSLTALAVGTLVSVPLGVWIARRPRAAAAVFAVTGVLQTVPGLALLAFMVPLLAALGLRAIGYLPAVVALSLYAVLPILRNTVTGLQGVDPAVREAADGVGMTPAQRLARVELPLALPVLIAGLRTASVWTVGTATLSTPVGASSLGDYIFAGLQTRQSSAVLLGCAASALLALALDGIIHLADRGIARRRRAPVVTAAALLLTLASTAALTLLARAERGDARVVTIGAKTFTEQYILARALAAQVGRRTGARTRVLESLGSAVVFDALRTGQIDAYVDYSGTLWTSVLHRGAPPADRAALRAELTRALLREHRVVVVAALGFENTYALAARPAVAAMHRLRSISDLARASATLTVGGDYEIFQRPEWRAITEGYGARFRAQRAMDPSLMYEAARSGQVDVITAFSTDGRIDAFGLVVCDDDRRVIPPYDALVLASERLARERPDVVRALAALEGTVSAGAMRALNGAVDRGALDPTRAGARLVR
ncbi:MAG: ABC transporter permease/substrate-binding protein [Polyangiales bacterium]